MTFLAQLGRPTLSRLSGQNKNRKVGLEALAAHLPRGKGPGATRWALGQCPLLASMSMDLADSLRALGEGVSVR